MNLLVRLIRALWVFGIIFSSYMSQFALVRLFRRFEKDPVSGFEDVVLPKWLAARRKRIDRKNARRLLRSMLQLRGVYIKLGQVLSIMGGLLPREYGEELSVLQDRVPPQPFSALVPAFVAAFGKRPQDLYASIDEEPLAAASLGQVHRAVGLDGQKLAVKVLYPGIRDVIRTDMRVIRLAMHVYRWFVPVDNIFSAYDSLADLLKRETNYVHEAECMARVARNFEGQDDIIIPRTIAALSGDDVLTMTFMEGIKINDIEGLEALGIDRNAVATRLTQCFYEQLFIHRFFHADPHPGNFLVQAGESPDTPRIVVLDFGAISEVKDGIIDGLIDVMQGFFEQENSLVLGGFERMGFVSPTGNRALVEKTVITYFRKLLQLPDRTPGALMRARGEELERLANPEVARMELRELMRSIRYPEGWFYVERASILLFWLVGQIDPDVDTMQVGFPYVLPLIAERTASRATAVAPVEPQAGGLSA